METNNEPQGNKQRKWNAGYIFGIFMVLIYLGMAYLLVFTPLFERNFAPVIRYGFGGVFVIYGIYRAYRLVKANRVN
ncbi:hypothetical protein [Coprobacter tertius]|uniref:Uncharacterized protein n=1 Tax=Coprobacter tertius TaxID=2944915 RepID=A0ABT1MGQ9_9BACT|nr:hypothetical protein [Coprobacter tertius]MCP9611566.1 hypothetical protein [Coprobacter tertius]